MIIGDDDVAAVLSAIEGDADGGVGVDGRIDEGATGELFREIRFQRKSIFRSESRAAMGEDPGESDNWSWEQLTETARDYLAESSKDLEPMAILIEGAVRLDGLPGLQSAMTLLAGLVEAFWEKGLYPPEDEEDGVEARFQPLSGLSGGGSDKDGTLIMPLRRMVLAGDARGELRYLDRVTADAQLGGGQGGSKGKAEGAQEALDEADATARRLSRRTLQAAADRLAASEAAWRRAIGYISERTKPRFPSASRVSDELRNMREWLESLLRKLPEDPVDMPADAAVADGAAPVAAAAAVAGGPMVLGRISQRDDALRAVAAAADYFERFEPLSPLGATLREVDRRARMSLDAFLEELIPDASVRQTYYWRSGIRPPADGSSS